MPTNQLEPAVRFIRQWAGHEATRRLTDAELVERFAVRREETAFAALVRRHGRLVLGVCRRVLRHEQDAEDSFQATFILLAQKVDSIRKGQSVASWLYGVAYRMAKNAKRKAARRRETGRLGDGVTGRLESHVADTLHQSVSRSPRPPVSPSPSPLAHASLHELQAILDEEVNRLPETYRSVFVTCCMQGKSQSEAAAELGWKEGTVAGRLNRARSRLQARLTRRGVTLSAALATAAIVEDSVMAAVPPALTHATIDAAMLSASGKALAAVLPASVAALVKGMSKAMVLAKVKVATGVILALGLATGGAGFVGHELSPQQTVEVQNSKTENKKRNRAPHRLFAQTPAHLSQKPTDETRREDKVTIKGSVLDPDGKPVADAEVAVLAFAPWWLHAGDFPERYRILVHGNTDAEGRFTLKSSRRQGERFRQVAALVKATGHGMTWQELNPEITHHEPTLKLVREKVIRGRLVDLQGQPAARVKVHLCRMGKTVRGEVTAVQFWEPPAQLEFWPGPVTTDEHGRFKFTGLNPSEGIAFQVRDDRFASEWIWVKPDTDDAEQVYPLPPPQTIEGRAVCADTGEAASNARLEISSLRGSNGTATYWRADENGRFRANPYPGESFHINIHAPVGKPYLSIQHKLTWPKGAVKQDVELRLPRGILVRGKVTESPLGSPVADAIVQYDPRRSKNDNLITGWQNVVRSGPGGEFQIALPPERGYLFVQGATGDHIQQEIHSNKLRYDKAGGLRVYTHGMAALDLKAEADGHTVSITLHRGVTVKGRVVDANGKPATEAMMVSRLVNHWPVLPNTQGHWRAFPVPVRDGRFDLPGCDPKATCPVFFFDAKNKLGAVVEVSGKQANETLTVRLAPSGAATARFLDAEGQPLANYRPTLRIVLAPGPHHTIKTLEQGILSADEEFVSNIDRLNHWDNRTDEQGRITFANLIPDVSYRITGLGEMDEKTIDFTVTPGQTLDLKDIVVKTKG